MWAAVKFIPVDGATPSLPKFQTKHSACADLEAHFHSQEVTVYDPHTNTKNKILLKQTVDAVKCITVYPKERVLIPTGWRMLIPFGFHASIKPRSGVSLKLGLTIVNSPGTIDADYTDEVFVIVKNDTYVPVAITDGDRIAQLEIVKNEVNHVYFQEGTEEELLAHKAESDRVGGFGSTGLNDAMKA